MFIILNLIHIFVFIPTLSVIDKVGSFLLYNARRGHFLAF